MTQESIVGSDFFYISILNPKVKNMLVFLSIFGIFLSLLLFLNSKRYHSSVYLSLFFLFSSLYVLYQYILLYSKSASLISIFLISMPVAVAPLYLIGPMLFWYVRSVLTDNLKLKRSDIWHFVPMVIFFISALPELFLPLNEKVELASKLAADTSFIGHHQTTFLVKVFPHVWLFVTRLILVMGYTLWSVYLLITYIRNNKLSTVFSGQIFVKKYLFCLLGFLLIVLLTQIAMVLKSFQLQFGDLYPILKVIKGISLVAFIGLLISTFFFPSILYGLIRIPDQDQNNRWTKSRLQPATVRQVSSTYEVEYLKKIENQVISYMEEHKPYRYSECNLYSFSKLIDIPPHHLAYYFREFKKERFNDFRNRWRVDHAKSLIQEGKANEVTLEAIGLLSGFSSRNAFITDFKKFVGESPGTYAARFN